MVSSHQLDDNGRFGDRIAIQDVLYRYARGVDRRDWNLVRSSYHTDGSDDHGMYKGGIDGLIDYLSNRHQTIDLSLHFLTNLYVEWIRPDAALVETYFISRKLQEPAGEEGSASAEQRGATEDRAVETEILGRYIDYFTREDGEWRIFERTVIYESSRSTLISKTALGSEYTSARRDGNDPLELKRRELGLT